MSKMTKNTALKLGFVGAVACSVCLLPLAIPVTVAVLGAGAVKAGHWVIGAGLIVAAGAALAYKRVRSCGCDSPETCRTCPTMP